MGIPITPPNLTPPAGDRANAVLIGNITTAAAGSGFPVYGTFNFSLTGTFTATVRLEKTFNGGSTYVPVVNINTGSIVALTSPGAVVVGEPERGVAYRANCTAYTSGTIAYRFSASGLMAQSEGAQTV